MTPTMLHWIGNCVLIFVICVISIAYEIIKERRNKNV